MTEDYQVAYDQAVSTVLNPDRQEWEPELVRGHNDYEVWVYDYFDKDFIILGGPDSACSAKLEGLGSPELRTSELDVPGSDGIYFGREYLGARKWTISGAIKSGLNPYVPGTPAEAWDELADLLRTWDYSRVRLKPREVMPLYWKRPGREAVMMYGRPERVDPETSVAHSGYIGYTAVFRQSDPKYYSTTENAVELALVSGYSGGLLYATTGTGLFASNGALQTTEATYQATVFRQEGDIDAHPIIEVKGPVVNPRISLSGADGELWEIRLQTEILWDQTVTIDTRPFARTVIRTPGNDNASGTMRGPRLNEAVIPPGQWTAIFTGQDATATSTCTIRYRNAWASV